MSLRPFHLPDSIPLQDAYNISPWTRDDEIQFLIWLAQQTPGNVLEIGCCEGHTTAALAQALPDKLIYGCDYTYAWDHTEQENERPSRDTFGIKARDLPNVRLHNIQSRRLPYHKLENLGLIFIDGDHRLETVRVDTRRAFACLDLKGARPAYIAWHDVYPDCPDWVCLWAFLCELNRDCRLVSGTRLAFHELS